MELTSPAFAHLADIPPKHTCEGADVAPALRIHGVPSTARSLALIVDDPDAPDPAAPKRTWVHWLAYNLPPSTTSLSEGGVLPHGAADGLNDWRRTGYGGPCPPVGKHRYFFKLYALDTELTLDTPSKTQLERAMDGHVLARAELIGLYQKHRK